MRIVHESPRPVYLTDNSVYTSQNTPVTKDNTYAGSSSRVFTMIDNYVYLYHTDTLIAIPTYPESISDNMAVAFNPATLLSRSAPIYSYANSGPRTVQLSLHLHRDMMNSVNVTSSNLNVPDLQREDYIDILVKQLQAAALPRYASAEKMVNPPIIAVRFGNDIFCKGIVSGSVGTTYSGPILRTDKYAEVTLDFQVHEIDPYDADTVMSQGHFRGISSDLERRIWKAAPTTIKSATSRG